MARSRLSSRLVVLQVHVLVLGCTRAQLEATTRLEQMAMALELQPTSAAARAARARAPALTAAGP